MSAAETFAAAPSAPVAERLPASESRIRRWAFKLGEFFLAQGFLQLLMALGGFLLLRWMPVDEYGAFTLGFAVQSAMIAFVDVGFSGAIVPLVGSRIGDATAIGAYVAAARALRRRLLPVVLLGGALALAVLGHRQGIGWPALAVMFALVAATVGINTVSVLNGAPLVIRQDLRFLHAVQNIMGVLRLVGYALAQAAGWLGSLFALALNLALNGGLAAGLRWRARTAYRELPDGDPAAVAARAEIVRFVRPQVPIMIFTALQGQIMVVLASLFGRGASLAETGALSRLGLVFAVTPALLGWIVQPYFARLESRLVRRRCSQIVAAGMGALALVPLAGWVAPEPFLWLLGPHYDHLSTEVALMLLTGALGAAVGLVATLLLARRQVPGDAIGWIAALTLGGQALAMSAGDISRPAGVLAVAIWGNAGSLLAYLFLAWRAFSRETDQPR